MTDEQREQAIEEIITQMIADPGAAFQPASALHRDFLVRCRIRRLGSAVPDLSTFRRRLATLRAREVYPQGADEAGWARAVETAQRLPDDMLGVFLLLCRAAVAGQACPGDDEIARFFGSHSPGRARRLLGQMEQMGLIVSRTDFQGRRIIAFPELEFETATEAGDAVSPAVT